jgi:hypothetical protein
LRLCSYPCHLGVDQCRRLTILIHEPKTTFAESKCAFSLIFGLSDDAFCLIMARSDGEFCLIIAKSDEMCDFCLIITRSEAMYAFGSILFGKEFSSDKTGDGPPGGQQGVKRTREEKTKIWLDDTDLALSDLLEDLKNSTQDPVFKEKLDKISKHVKAYRQFVNNKIKKIDEVNSKLKVTKLAAADRTPITLDWQAEAIVTKYAGTPSTRPKMIKVLESLQFDWTRRLLQESHILVREQRMVDKQIWIDFAKLLDEVEKNAVMEIKLRASPEDVARMMDSGFSLNGAAINEVGKLMGKYGNSNFFPSSNRVGHACRELEQIALSRIDSQLTDDNLSFTIDVEDVFKLLIDTVLIPANWNPENTFVTCATMDGTRKNLQNIVIAGIKFCKILEQNKCFNIDTSKIHSEKFYFPLVGSLCKENQANAEKYFFAFFNQIMEIEHQGIFHRGCKWNFEFLCCTDLKAEWALLKFGGPNNDIKSCCPADKIFNDVNVDICAHCLRRDPYRTKSCSHVDMLCNVKSTDIETPWKLPTTLAEKANNKVKALISEESLDEIQKGHNEDLITKHLLARFSTEGEINRNLRTMHQNSRHSLLRYCYVKERQKFWLQETEKVASVAGWVNRMTALPDTLHLEMRVGEEALTQVFQVLLMNRIDLLPGQCATRVQEEKKRRLGAVSEVIGRLISNNEGSNFIISTVENHEDQIKKIGMNNDRLRRVFDGFEQVINVMYSEDDKADEAVSQNIVILRRIINNWIDIRDKLRSDENFEDGEADAWQDAVDEWVIDYKQLFPGSGGCYLHMLHRGHIREYLIWHGNLHIWCNIDGEAHNGFLKNVVGHRSQNNGHKGGKHNPLMVDGEQTEYLAMTLKRLYTRRIMWMFDPTALDRLKVKKDLEHMKLRDVLTVESNGYRPANFVTDEKEILKSLYDSDNYHHTPITNNVDADQMDVGNEE